MLWVTDHQINLFMPGRQLSVLICVLIKFLTSFFSFVTTRITTKQHILLCYAWLLSMTINHVHNFLFSAFSQQELQLNNTSYFSMTELSLTTSRITCIRETDKTTLGKHLSGPLMHQAYDPSVFGLLTLTLIRIIRKVLERIPLLGLHLVLRNIRTDQ